MKKAIWILFIAMFCKAFGATTLSTDPLNVYWDLDKHSYFILEFTDADGNVLVDGLTLEIDKTEDDGVTGKGSAYFRWNVIENGEKINRYVIGFNLQSESAWLNMSWQSATANSYSVIGGTLSSSNQEIKEAISLDVSSSFGNKSEGRVPISFNTEKLSDYTKNYTALVTMLINSME